MTIQTLLQRFDSSYAISKTMAPQSGGHTDFRNYCNNISEFETFATTVQEVRQEGLITYELSTKKTKRCKKNGSNWTWEEIPTIDTLFRDIIDGEIFELHGVIPPPAIVYGNIVLSTSSLSVNENATNIFTVKLDKAPTNNQVVTLSKINADVTLSHSTLTFTPSNYNVAQNVTITVAEDSDHANENDTITLASSNVSSKTIAVSIIDNDAEPIREFEINYLKLTRQKNQLVMPNELLINGEIDVVHPSCLYFPERWNGYEYWLAINPYPKTTSLYENPCMLVSNDGDTWITKGNVPIYPIMPGAQHNSDCHIFMNDNTMVYINRGATDGSCMIEYFTSTDGENWSERTKIIDSDQTIHNYLSPSICKYNNEWYMFVYNNKSIITEEEKKLITVLKSDGDINGNWNIVNTIKINNVDTIWHLEVKLVNNEFLALIMTGKASGGNLALSKFKTPLDKENINCINAPIVLPSGKTNVETVLYKSTFVKRDEDTLELFINSKSKGTLDAFCHWSLNRSVLQNVPSEVLTSPFTKEIICTPSDLNKNLGTHIGKEIQYYNYEVDFKIADPNEFFITPCTSGTSDYWYLEGTPLTCSFQYCKGGNVQITQNIIFRITPDTIFKFIKDNNILSLYIDNRLVGKFNEKDYDNVSPNYFKRVFGVCPKNTPGSSSSLGNVNHLAYIKIKTRSSESIDVPKMEQELLNVINNYTSTSPEYLVFDDFNRENGVLVTTTNGLPYSTTNLMPSIINNQLVNINGNNTALLEVNSSDYVMYADLRPSFNGHYLYLRYIDVNNYIVLSFGGNDGMVIITCTNGIKDKKNYNIFNSNLDKYIIKATVRNSKLTVNMNNQDVLIDFDLYITTPCKVGFGANLANCKMDTFVVKRYM